MTKIACKFKIFEESSLYFLDVNETRKSQLTNKWVPLYLV